MKSVRSTVSLCLLSDGFGACTHVRLVARVHLSDEGVHVVREELDPLRVGVAPDGGPVDVHRGHVLIPALDPRVLAAECQLSRQLSESSKSRFPLGKSTVSYVSPKLHPSAGLSVKASSEIHKFP